MRRSHNNMLHLMHSVLRAVKGDRELRALLVRALRLEIPGLDVDQTRRTAEEVLAALPALQAALTEELKRVNADPLVQAIPALPPMDNSLGACVERLRHYAQNKEAIDRCARVNDLRSLTVFVRSCIPHLLRRPDATIAA